MLVVQYSVSYVASFSLFEHCDVERPCFAISNDFGECLRILLDQSRTEAGSRCQNSSHRFFETLEDLITRFIRKSSQNTSARSFSASMPAFILWSISIVKLAKGSNLIGQVHMFTP